jgi:hypothetical protein
MSIYFTLNEQDFWNPGRVTAQMFCGQVALVARELGMESGLGAIISDEVKVEAEQFKTFAAAFAEYMTHLQPGGKAWLLVAGCFTLVGALAQRLGAAPPIAPELAKLVADGVRVIG